MSDEPADSVMVGRVIAERYAIRRLLGAGGMGAVYEAENTWTHRRVAIKLLRPELLANATTVSRFLQEARTAATLRHVHVVDVLDMGREADTGALYIVQELLEGESLRQRLDAAPRLALDEVLAIVGPIVSALESAHARGIVHRDIKPENIFLARDAAGALVPKLIDFGISKVISSEASEALHKTRTGTTVGTPYYMSPEQARADTAIDRRSDVWSLGAVTFEMLAGRCPFDAPTYSLLLVQIITEDAPRIEQFAPEVPRGIADAIDRALRRDRDARFATAHAFDSALRRAAGLPEAPLLRSTPPDAPPSVEAIGLADTQREISSPAPAASSPPPAQTLSAPPATLARNRSSAAVPSAPGAGRRPGRSPAPLLMLGAAAAIGVWYGRNHRGTSAPAVDPAPRRAAATGTISPPGVDPARAVAVVDAAAPAVPVAITAEPSAREVPAIAAVVAPTPLAATARPPHPPQGHAAAGVTRPRATGTEHPATGAMPGDLLRPTGGYPGR